MSKAYIIGTGPGHENLLTLEAINCLKKCTAVLYDRLIGGNILKYLNKDCKVYYCGKEPNCHYKTQDEINDILVSLAKEGHIVGRVKGGDPFVFGRGGEEILALNKEGIEFQVVPGVTSAIAALSYAGIPATHRGLAQSFHVITGMSHSTLNTDWESLAKVEGTLIFLMGLENLGIISENLIANGKNPNTPCGLVMRGTTSKQKVVTGVLSNIREKALESGIKSPTIIVVGEVVTLRDEFSWYEEKELFGLNVCLTRTLEQGKNLASKLMDLGAHVTQIPAIEIEENKDSLKPYVESIESFNHIVFTSPNSVNVFFNILKDAKVDVRKLKGNIYSIGEGTEHALNEVGIISDYKSKVSTSEAMAEDLKVRVRAGEKVLIPTTALSRGVIAKELEKIGADVTVVNIYETKKGKILNENSFKDVDVIVFTSPSTFNNLCEMVGLDKIKEKKIVSIGPVTSKELKEKQMDFVECESPTEEEIIKLLLEMRTK